MNKILSILCSSSFGFMICIIKMVTIVNIDFIYVYLAGGGGDAEFNDILWKSPARVFSSGSPSPFGAGDPGEKAHGYHRVNYVDNGNQTFSNNY